MFDELVALQFYIDVYYSVPHHGRHLSTNVFYTVNGKKELLFFFIASTNVSQFNDERQIAKCK